MRNDIELKELAEDPPQVRAVIVPIPQLVKGASLTAAQGLDARGKWRQAADHFYTISVGKGPLQDRIEGILGVAQMRINWAAFDLARKTLVLTPKMTGELLEEPDLQARFNLQCLIKEGWCLDLEGRFKKSSEVFQEAYVLAGKLGDPGAISTANHFLARAFLGQAAEASGDVPAHIKRARHFYNYELKQLTSPGMQAPANVGFQYTGLARLDLLEEQYDLAQNKLELARENFELFLKDHPDSAIMGHYHQVKGELLFRTDRPSSALLEFSQAFDLSCNLNRPHYVEAAEAARGLAKCSLLLGDVRLAQKWSTNSQVWYPEIINRPFGV